MTDQARSFVDLLQHRLTLVAGISALYAEALKRTQTLAAADMDIQRIELAIGKNDATEELVRELLDTRKSAEAMRTAQAECDERIGAAERDVAELDRLLAATDAN